jgi:hypothetical protein
MTRYQVIVKCKSSGRSVVGFESRSRDVAEMWRQGFMRHADDRLTARLWRHQTVTKTTLN